MRARAVGAGTILALVVGIGGAAMVGRAPAATAIASPAQQTSWQVQVGAESADNAVQVLRNYPAQLTVAVGDTITWTNPTAELHTVTFLAPGQARPRFDRDDPLQAEPQGSGAVDGAGYLNSGLLQDGKSFTAAAAEVGTFTYICLLHPHQESTIVVLPAGSAVEPSPSVQEALRAAASIVDQWQAQFAAYQPSVRQRPNNTREHVISGGMGDSVAAVMRFQPQALQIRVGDTVTWDNSDVETPHVVTFGPMQGPPDRVWGNPSAFNGSDALNSGFFGKAWPAGATYSVTFTTAGQYAYVCPLHTSAGMFGLITVQP